LQLDLIARVIQWKTNPGDVVLDPFGGIVGFIGEILAMYLAVTSFTQGNAVINIESQVGELCPFLNVVSVDILLRAARLAGISIPRINLIAPLFQLAGQARSISLQSSPVPPSRCARAGARFGTAPLRAVRLCPVSLKGLATIGAHLDLFMRLLPPSRFQVAVPGTVFGDPAARINKEFVSAVLTSFDDHLDPQLP
jgi:hypothetical protein